MTDMLNHERLETRLRTIAGGFKKRYGDLLSDYDVEAELARLKVMLALHLACLSAANTMQSHTERLRPYICDQVALLRDAQKEGGILIEGANALMVWTS